MNNPFLIWLFAAAAVIIIINNSEHHEREFVRFECARTTLVTHYVDFDGATVREGLEFDCRTVTRVAD